MEKQQSGDDGGGDGASRGMQDGKHNDESSSAGPPGEAIDQRANEAFATMVISDDFAIGAEVMFHSLRDHSRIRRSHVVLVTSDVSEGNRQMLKATADEVVEYPVTPRSPGHLRRVRGESPDDESTATADEVVEVEPIPMPPPEGTDLTVPGSGEYLGYTTLRVWGLTQYEQVVYIDADTLITECIDELFDRKVSFAAAPDVFPPDRFNPGVMVLTPSLSVLEDMLSKISDLPSYDGRDTGFLNAYFPDWYTSQNTACRLPCAYNALRTVYHTTYKRTPGYWKAIGPTKIIHFNGHLKPWEDGAPIGDLEMMWWKRYLEMPTE